MRYHSPREILQRHGITYIETKKKSYTTDCPYCRNGYLNVAKKSDGVVWYCRHCEEGNGEKFEQDDNNRGTERKGDGKLGPEKDVYKYPDESGKRLFDVVRFDPPGGEKQLRARKPNAKKWGIGDTRRVLYRLDELIKDIAAERVIFVVEGEKDSDTLRCHGIPATTNPFGATTEEKQSKGSGWLRSYTESLRGADVVLCGDNDAPGREHVRIVGRELHGIARRLRVLDLKKFWPEIQESDDITDWFGAGHKVEELWQIVGVLPDYQPPEETRTDSTDNTTTGGQAVEGELNADIKTLAALPISTYAVKRKPEAARLGMPVGMLDAAVKAQRDRVTKEQTDFLTHWNVEPWSEAVDGAELLTELRGHFNRYLVLPKRADVVLALWTLLTWVFDCFDITPYLAITSPTRRCGKTLLMTMLYWLCCRAKKNDSMSRAAIYRSVESERPTLLLDETSWVVDQKDDRQGILCGGFERNGFVENCEGESANITVRRYSTYCPKAFGLIGKLTATLMDRSIEFAMQRKKNERVERLRRRDNERHAELRRKCLRWAKDNRKTLAAIEPKLPQGLNDRAVDIWEPLLAIAEQVGDDWPKLADQAALALSSGEAATEDRSVELLADIKATFDASGLDEITTKALLAALCADEERRWATYNKGKQISDRQVAKLLKQFSIFSEDVYPPGEKHAKGYKRGRFLDAFERYLDPPNGASPQITGSQPCERVNADEMGTSRDFSIRVESDLHGCEKYEKPANDGTLHGYTDKNPQTSSEGPSDRHSGGNGPIGCGATPDDDLTIPPILDRRAEPSCDRCGLPGGTECAYDGVVLRLHSHCTRPWIDAYEVRRRNGAGASS